MKNKNKGFKKAKEFRYSLVDKSNIKIKVKK
jgi:hypothetical protein